MYTNKNKRKGKLNGDIYNFKRGYISRRFKTFEENFIYPSVLINLKNLNKTGEFLTGHDQNWSQKRWKI